MKFPVDILFQMLYTIFAVDETDKQLAERSGAGMVTVPDKPFPQLTVHQGD